MWISTLALRVGVGDDDVEPGQQLARLHQGQRVRRASLGQRDAVVAQRPQVHVHGRRVGGTRALKNDGKICNENTMTIWTITFWTVTNWTITVWTVTIWTITIWILKQTVFRWIGKVIFLIVALAANLFQKFTILNFFKWCLLVLKFFSFYFDSWSLQSQKSRWNYNKTRFFQVHLP